MQLEIGWGHSNVAGLGFIVGNEVDGSSFTAEWAIENFRIPRDPTIQVMPTLGPNVCKCYLHWAIWIPEPQTPCYMFRV